MDEQEARRLAETYSDMILRVSYSYLKQTYDAEDICQSVLVKLIMGGYEFESAEHEKAWIIRTTINTCKNYLRRAYFTRTVPIDEVPEPYAPEEPGQELLEVIKLLPREYRLSIYLYYYEGYSAKEIGAILGKRTNAVQAYLSRGRKKLREYLTEGMDNATIGQGG